MAEIHQDKDENPYRSPEATLSDPPSSPLRPMYSSGQIVVASLGGTAVAGFWLLGSNYGAARRPMARWICFVVGATATIAFYWLLTPTLIMATREVKLLLALAILYGPVLVVYLLAHYLQSALYIEHLRKNGTQYSWWRALAIAGGFYLLLTKFSFEIRAFLASVFNYF